jgi:molecular chaperone DnaK
VTFDIDANGIVNVTAKDKATNKEQQIRIQASGGLSDAEIEKMVKDAEAHASEDKVRRELVEAKNQAESLIHSTEKSVSEHGDKVSAGDKTAIESAIEALKSALAGEDPETIKARTTDLMQASMKLGEAMYAAGQGDSGAEHSDDHHEHHDDAHGKDDVIDADFREVGEDDVFGFLEVGLDLGDQIIFFGSHGRLRLVFAELGRGDVNAGTHA